MNVVANDLMVNYQLSGKGKLVLLLHGWGDSAKGLSALANELSKKYQVLSLDLPGFGASQAPTSVWDLDNYANFLELFLNKVGVKQPYTVVGHSNGGALAIRAVNINKLKPQKLILLAASGIRTGQASKRLVLKVIAKAGNIATIWMPERYRRALRKSLYGAAGSDALVAPHLLETFKRTVRQDVQTDAAALDVPTLLIYGKNDRAVPIADGQKYHALIKNSKLEIIDSEHFVHQEQPEQVVKLIMEFLK